MTPNEREDQYYRDPVITCASHPFRPAADSPSSCVRCGGGRYHLIHIVADAPSRGIGEASVELKDALDKLQREVRTCVLVLALAVAVAVILAAVAR